MDKKYDVIISGYVSIDRIIDIDTPLRVGYTSIVKNADNSKMYYGGCSINIAYALAKLGLKTIPYVRVGGDWEDNGLKNFLNDGNVLTDAVTVIDEDSTSNCYLIENSEGDHVTVFYPGAMDSKYAKQMNNEFFQNSKMAVLTVGSYLDNLYFYEGCKRNNIPLVFGMKADYTAFPKDLLWEILNYAQIIFVNNSERDNIESIYKLECITDLFKTGNAKIIVTTLGKRGSIFYEKKADGHHFSKEMRVRSCDNVVDTTGSGDAYMSGFIYGYLNDNDTETNCNLGSTLSAFIIQKRGCCTNAPTKELLIKSYEEEFKK